MQAILNGCFTKRYVCNSLGIQMKDMKQNDYRGKVMGFLDYFHNKNLLMIVIESINKTKELNQKTLDIPLIEYMNENKIPIYNAPHNLPLPSYNVRRFLVEVVYLHIPGFTSMTVVNSTYDIIRFNFNGLLNHLFQEYLLNPQSNDQKKKSKKVEAITIVL